MTSKLTRLTDDELTETLRQATSGYPLPASVEGNLRHAFAELQERRKADSEPVAWTDEEELRDVNVAGIGYLFGIDREANKFADPRRQIMLYRHAQPAPVVTFYRDGIEAAAKWIDQQREAYDSEHGWSDPGTGSFEFGNDAQREYSSTLEELAEGIRSLHPNAGNSPVIPDGSASMLRRWLVFGRGMQNAGSQLPHNLIAETEEMLAAADCSIPMISDRWVPVSERMPDDDDFVYIWPRPDFGVELHVGQYCECSPKGDGWYAQVYEQNYGIEWYPITVTHWMPLPASPQEVNHG